MARRKRKFTGIRVIVEGVADGQMFRRRRLLIDADATPEEELEAMVNKAEPIAKAVAELVRETLDETLDRIWEKRHV